MESNHLIEQLYEVIAGLKTKEEVALLLDDLCTYKELEYMAQRIEAARLLLDGHTYNEVTDEVNISSATLSRVSKCVKYKEGYRKLLPLYLSNKEN